VVDAVSRHETTRFPRLSLRRALKILLLEDADDTLTGISLHWTEGHDVRLSYTVRDERRPVDLPGVHGEPDEADFDDPDTDLDP
jgi:hypothetical protein